MGICKVKTEIRKPQILKASLDIIASRGIKGLTISAIAEKVGMARGNLYRHYQNKESVVDSIITLAGENLEKIVKEACHLKGNPHQCLEYVFCQHLTFLENNRGMLRIIFSDEMYSENKHLIRKLKAVVTAYINEVKNILQKGINEEYFDQDMDVNAAALAFLGLIQSIALQWIIADFSFSPKERGKKIWKVYLNGILLKS